MRGGRGKEKTLWNRDMRRSAEGRGMKRGHRVNKMDTTGTLRSLHDRQGLSGKKAGNLKEVGLGWISGCRKDRGFGWGKIRDGGEQLF